MIANNFVDSVNFFLEISSYFYGLFRVPTYMNTNELK